MDGAKKILVFSDAGGTGRSYHACLRAKNQARRIHYLLEPGWRADAAIQGLGRTHRTNQASAPLFRPVTTDVRGERRFISTIARRLDTLGALTRGQRQTGGQNLFDPADNLESDYAKDALIAWYRLLFAGKLQSTTLGDFEELTGLTLEGRGRRSARRPAADPALAQPPPRLADRAAERDLRRVSRPGRGAGRCRAQGGHARPRRRDDGGRTVARRAGSRDPDRSHQRLHDASAHGEPGTSPASLVAG